MVLVVVEGYKNNLAQARWIEGNKVTINFFSSAHSCALRKLLSYSDRLQCCIAFVGTSTYPAIVRFTRKGVCMFYVNLHVLFSGGLVGIAAHLIYSFIYILQGITIYMMPSAGSKYPKLSRL